MCVLVSSTNKKTSFCIFTRKLLLYIHVLTVNICLREIKLKSYVNNPGHCGITMIILYICSVFA